MATKVSIYTAILAAELHPPQHLHTSWKAASYKTVLYCLRLVKCWCLQATARAFLNQPACADSVMVSAGKRKDVLIMDRPFYSHWPKLVVFLLFEINNLFINIWISSGEVHGLLVRCA